MRCYPVLQSLLNNDNHAYSLLDCSCHYRNFSLNDNLVTKIVRVATRPIVIEAAATEALKQLSGRERSHPPACGYVLSSQS